MRYLVLASLLMSCSGSTALREPDEYTGCGTDEHWRTFDDQEPLATTSDAMAPQFTQPAAGAAIAASAKPTLTWSQDPNDPGQNAGDVPYMGVGCNNCCPEFNTGALNRMDLLHNDVKAGPFTPSMPFRFSESG